MKWWLTFAWVALAAETVLLIAWMLFALRATGRDPGERVWTTLFSVGPAIFLAIAGLLLFQGQRSQSALTLGCGVVLVFTPIALVAVRGGVQSFASWERARGRERAFRAAAQFDQPAATEMAGAIQRQDLASLRQQIASRPPDNAARNASGDSLASLAIRQALASRGDNAIAAGELLIAAGARLPRDAPGATAPLLLTLIEDGHPDSLRLLDLALRAGGDPNATDRDGDALIHQPACSRAKLEIVLRHGADPGRLTGRPDRAGWTALMIAAHFGDWDRALFLAEAGVALDHRAPDGTTLVTVLQRVARITSGTGQKPDPRLHILEQKVAPAGLSASHPQSRPPP